MKPMGGTEILFQNLQSAIGSEWNPDVNLIVATCRHDSVLENKKNIVWQHLNVDQDNVQLMSDNSFVDKIDQFVYVSNWQYEKYRHAFNIPENKSRVIKNAIRKIEFIPKIKTEKIKLIYTSTPWRGLGVLLDAFEKLNRDDVELDVYSSTVIYGKGYHQMTQGMYDALFAKAKRMKNVNYMGYASNDGVRKAVQKAHIYTYPSIFEETSCLSALEAAAAGCKLLVTNYGALYETCSEWATYVPFTSDREVLVDKYAKELNRVIDNYKHDDPMHEEQSKFFNKFWSWENRIPQWRDLLSETAK